MNAWDILDGIEIFGGKLSKIVKRVTLFGIILVPSFGGWMVAQLISRQEANAHLIATLIAKPVTDSVNCRLQLAAPVQSVTVQSTPAVPTGPYWNPTWHPGH